MANSGRLFSKRQRAKLGVILNSVIQTNYDIQDREEAEIEDLLTHGLKDHLAFRPEMELKFQNFYRRHIVKSIRQLKVIAAIAYTLIGVSCLVFVPPDALAVWLVVYMSVAMIGFLLFQIPSSINMQQYHQAYLGCGLCFNATLVLITSFALTSELQSYMNYSFIFLMIVVYTSNLLNFKTACFTAWGSGAAGVLIANVFQLTTNWGILSYFFIITNIIGMGICYQNERATRQNFLQQTLLALEKIQLRKMGEQLIVISRQDGLTNIANRRHFEESYKREWLRGFRHNQLLSVIFIDVDFYKHYNDAYGHQQGGKCLIALAQCINDQVSRPEDLVARYGGEEFIMLLPTVDEQGAVKIAQRVQTAISTLNMEHKASDISNIVTVSMGIASTVPKSVDTRPTLIRRADAALYHAKSSGRNCWRIAPSRRMLDNH